MCIDPLLPSSVFLSTPQCCGDGASSGDGAPPRIGLASGVAPRAGCGGRRVGGFPGAYRQDTASRKVLPTTGVGSRLDDR